VAEEPDEDDEALEDEEEGLADAEPVELPADAESYLALLDAEGWFDDLPPEYVAKARAGVAAAYAKGKHPATGLAIHSIAHSEDAEPLWFGTLLKEIVTRSHGLLVGEDVKVQKNKKGDYVAKLTVAGEPYQATLHEGRREGARDPIFEIAALLENVLEAQEITDKGFGYFTDADMVLHWYLRPRDVPLPPGLVPDDTFDPLEAVADMFDMGGEDEEEDDDDEDADEDEE
jgi:hypothetical protein